MDPEREERARDEWLVLDLCGNGHRGPDGVVRRTACESHFRQTVGRQKETDENAAWRRPMRKELGHRTRGGYSKSEYRDTLL